MAEVRTNLLRVTLVLGPGEALSARGKRLRYPESYGPVGWLSPFYLAPATWISVFHRYAKLALPSVGVAGMVSYSTLLDWRNWQTRRP